MYIHTSPTRTGACCSDRGGVSMVIALDIVYYIVKGDTTVITYDAVTVIGALDVMALCVPCGTNSAWLLIW